MNAFEVVPGLVRMARREWLTDAGWRAATSAGYRTVVDLRCPWELARMPLPGDPEVSDAARAGVVVVNAPTEDPEHPEFERVLGPYLDHPRAYPDYVLLFGDRVAAALVALARADGPVIVHCAAGRDRTGLVVALGQKLAGWSDADIVAGYVASATAVNDHHLLRPRPREPHLSGAEWDAWLGERVTALSAFLADLDAAELLRDEGVADADLAAIRARFERPEG